MRVFGRKIKKKKKTSREPHSSVQFKIVFTRLGKPNMRSELSQMAEPNDLEHCFQFWRGGNASFEANPHTTNGPLINSTSFSWSVETSRVQNTLSLARLLFENFVGKLMSRSP